MRALIRSLLPKRALAATRFVRRRWALPTPLIQNLVDRYCIGNGVEIGAGPVPYCPPERTDFVDKHIANADASLQPDIVADAAAIPAADAKYDFVFSSHCLEHVPNTIRTLMEWGRILRPGGALVLILPHGDRTFDRLRAKTTLDHHI